MATLRGIAKNVAIIGVGSAALIWWDKRQSAIPTQVRNLAVEAVALEQQNISGDGGSSARKKWKEANAIANAHGGLSPKVSFNLAFALALNFENAGDRDLAEFEFKRALASFPPGYDLHSLEENTRNRVGVTLDRLAQFEQDRGGFAQAMVLYDRALDALALPEEVATMTPAFLERTTHVQTIAGILNNIATLYKRLGKEDAGRATLERSEKLMDAMRMSSINVGDDSNNGPSTNEEHRVRMGGLQ